MSIAIAISGAAGLAAGAVGGYVLREWLGKQRTDETEKRADRLLNDARREAQTLLKESKVQVKDEMFKAREDFERSTRDRRKELEQMEERIIQRESNLDRKVALLDKKDHTLQEKLEQAERQSAELTRLQEEARTLVEEEKARLQKVADMTPEEARKHLLSTVEKEVHGEMGGLIRRMQEQARDTAEREARNIVATAIERFASSHASEMMTSSVALPNDDVKGRIIGREGRNIRSLEAETGVSLLIDDTPEAVVISGFDPVRREVARRALEQLVADGRIHPARIEEVVRKVRDSMDETIRTTGEESLYKAGIQDVAPELMVMIGRLKFRTSYSQNVLDHSLEVAHLMGVMAGDLKLDVPLAKRIGLFHDIGKALDHEVEGGHAVIGADLLRRHGEAAVVVNAVAAHHEDVAPESLYAVLASAADSISSSRPGARSETSAIYVKRLEKLEAIANGFKGVGKSYALQAGREIRVIVEPKAVDDNQAVILARDISKGIEANLQYPGQIRVVVVRETRCVEYAR
jgi:ribonucrease Y